MGVGVKHWTSMRFEPGAGGLVIKMTKRMGVVHIKF